MIVIFAVLGLLVGSFVYATVWRLHMQEQAKSTKSKKKYSISKGRSQCPNCKHQLAWYDLIPLASWLILGGKCRYCKKPISIEYPLTEISTSALFVWFSLFWQFNGLANYIQFGLWLAILTGLIMLTIYDLRWFELPHQIIYTLIGLAAVLLVIRAFSGDVGTFFSGIGAALVAGGFFYGLHAISDGKWMGGGDVKLAFLMGLLLGFQKLLLAMMIGFISAAILSGILIAAKKLTRKDMIPFGPFLIAGTILAQIHGTQIINAYLNLFLIY